MIKTKSRIITICSIIFATILTICSIKTPNSNIVYAQVNLDLTAKSCLLVDYNMGEVLYEKNPTARLPIASMVKMMTLLLSYEAMDDGLFDNNTLITTTENASQMGGSQVFIDPYVEYKAGDLLKSVVMASANDASVALGEFIAGSEDEFVSRMNNRAKELGMNNTVYVNCTGLPAPEQYSCAKDCAIIIKEVMKHKEYHEVSSIWMDELVHPSGRKTELVNTNKLVRYYKGCDSGKTGSTNEAGYCLTTSAMKDDFRLICVVIGSKSGQDRFKDATTLLNYGFANFQNKKIIDKTVAIKEDCEVLQGKIKNISVFAKEDYYGICQKGDKSSYDISYNINDIKAPVKENDVVGKLIISKNGKVVYETELIVLDSVEKIGILDGIRKIAENW